MIGGMGTSYSFLYKLKWARELGFGYSPLVSAIKSHQTREILRAWGCDLFPHLLFLCRRTTRWKLGENWWGSRQLRMLSLFSVIWSLFQFLVIVDYFLVLVKKKHIESTMLCYSLAKHARFYEPGVVTFSRRYVTRYSKRYLRALATSYWLGINTI